MKIIDRDDCAAETLGEATSTWKRIIKKDAY